MPFTVPIDSVRKQFPQFNVIGALTPSEQKAAFHVKDKEGKDLCLKIISPDYELDRLKREIIALQKLDHPNVVKLIEYSYISSVGAEKHYMVEEFISGVDLRELLTEEDWNLSTSIEFFVNLYSGLEALSEIRVVHRDLKPGNIRVNAEKSPVIIDFGLARHLEMPDLTKTEAGAAIGTPVYFAPEQFNGTKYDIDHRTDLYTSGLLIYQILTGSHPYYKEDMSFSQLRDACASSKEHLENPKYLALPPKLRLLIAKLLEKQRASRPHRAAIPLTVLKGIQEEI